MLVEERQAVMLQMPFDQIKANLANIQPENLQISAVNGLKKQNTLYKPWNASCKLKTNKMKEAFGGLEFGLTEMCFPTSPGSRHKYKLTMILRQHYHYIGHLFAFFTTNMGRCPWAPSLDLPHILGGVMNHGNSFDNLNIKP